MTDGHTDPGRADHPPPSRARYPSLDGLRGIAAAVVVVHHCMLVSPELATTVLDGHPTGELAQWLVYTPVHLLWAGSEAVVVFFVLSGLVLTLPFTAESSRPPWRGYYPQRLVRLYLPVAASVALATIQFISVPRSGYSGTSWWMQAHDIRLTPALLARDTSLASTTPWLNSVLWSLKPEVIFSLALPLAIVLARCVGRGRLAVLAAMPLLIIVVGLAGFTIAVYMLIFGIGVLMAAERARLRIFALRVPTIGWAAIVIAALTLLLAGWWPIIGHSPIAPAMAASGAAFLVAAAMWFQPVERLCRTSFITWLGRRSFSLYLVHEPIVVTVTLILRTSNPLIVLAIAAPAALVVSAGFYQLIEAPSQKLAKALGRRTVEKTRIART